MATDVRPANPVAIVAAKKVVLVSRSCYEARHDHLLQSLIDRKIVLFCAVGRDCAAWEDAMDWLCIGPSGEGSWHVVTTSHPDESVEEVVAFADAWSVDKASGVEIIEV